MGMKEELQGVVEPANDLVINTTYSINARIWLLCNVFKSVKSML